jgi:hypothetical protein
MLGGALKRILASMLVLLASACVKQPKTPAEFRAAVQEGSLMTKKEERKITRGFSAAFASVRAGAERCLNTSKTSSTPGKYGPETSRVDYHATVKGEANSAEVTVQMSAANMIGSYPEGGPFIFVADLAGSGDDATSVTVYAAGKGRDISEPLFAWAAGKGEACPEF